MSGCRDGCRGVAVVAVKGCRGCREVAVTAQCKATAEILQHKGIRRLVATVAVKFLEVIKIFI